MDQTHPDQQMEIYWETSLASKVIGGWLCCSVWEIQEAKASSGGLLELELEPLLLTSKVAELGRNQFRLLQKHLGKKCARSMSITLYLFIFAFTWVTLWLSIATLTWVKCLQTLWETSLNDGRACFGPQKSPDTDISLQLLIKFCKFYIEINWFEIFFCLLPDFVILKLCYLYELFSFWALKYQHFHITSYFGLSDDAIFKH